MGKKWGTSGTHEGKVLAIPHLSFSWFFSGSDFLSATSVETSAFDSGSTVIFASSSFLTRLQDVENALTSQVKLDRSTCLRLEESIATL